LDTNALVQVDLISSRFQTENGDGALVRYAETGDRLDRRRLAGTVRTDNSEDLTALHREGHVVDGNGFAIALAQVLNLDDWHVSRLGERRLPGVARAVMKPDGLSGLVVSTKRMSRVSQWSWDRRLPAGSA
jgi:hypothetical protein